MEKLKVIIKAIFVTTIFVWLLRYGTSCTTIRYIQAELPEYKIVMPERPEIKTETEDIVKLMRYSFKLESKIEQFQQFYDSLREVSYGNRKIKNQQHI